MKQLYSMKIVRGPLSVEITYTKVLYHMIVGTTVLNPDPPQLSLSKISKSQLSLLCGIQYTPRMSDVKRKLVALTLLHLK